MRTNKEDCLALAVEVAEHVAQLGLLRSCERADMSDTSEIAYEGLVRYEYDVFSSYLRYSYCSFRRLDDIYETMRAMSDRGRLKRFISRETDKRRIVESKSQLDKALQLFIVCSICLYESKDNGNDT